MDFEQLIAGILKDSPLNHDKWKELLSSAEATRDVRVVNKVFPTFLKLFPYCFGYWLKYAKLIEKFDTSGNDETRHKAVIQIYEDATKAFALSKDIWLSYIEYLAKNVGQLPPRTKIGTVYTRAIEATGSLPDSVELWLKYLEHITSRPKKGTILVSIYKDILSRPLNKLELFWSQFVGSVLPQQEPSKQIQIKREVFAIYEQTKLVVKRRQTFEDSLSPEEGGRPFFHFEPLNEGQLETWRKYIDYMMNESANISDVKLLFERCLITCANYSEFWIRYIVWMENRNEDIKVIENVFKRGVNSLYHIEPKFAIHYAEFLEQEGNMQRAREIYKNLTTYQAKGWVEGILSFAHFERRQHKVNEAIHILDEALALANDSTRPFLTMKRAMLANDIGIVKESIEKYQSCASNLRLWIFWFEFERQHLQNQRQILEKALLSSSLKAEDKNILWERYTDFLLEEESDIAALRQARSKHISARGFKRKKNTSS